MSGDTQDLRRIIIDLPSWMLDDLREGAQLQDITVSELIRRGVSLDRKVRDEVGAGRRIVIEQDPDDPLPKFVVEDRA